MLGTVFTLGVYLRRLVGGQTLLRFVTGRYNRPREEERVLLFADIKGSTSIAERIGNRLYHESTAVRRYPSGLGAFAALRYLNFFARYPEKGA